MGEERTARTGSGIEDGIDAHLDGAEDDRARVRRQIEVRISSPFRRLTPIAGSPASSAASVSASAFGVAL